MSAFVDTHCHIQSAGGNIGERGTRELWAKDPGLQPEMIIDGAKQAGVNKLICVGCDVGDSQLAVDFVQGKQGCWASVGIHPHEAKRYAQENPEPTGSLKDFEALVSRPKVVAIGECGLDYFYEHSLRQEQEKILRFQIELAQKHHLPIIFHVREAFDDFWRIAADYQGIRGVLHSFTDNSENLDKALVAGFYIGVNGIVTFAKDPGQLEVYRSIPLERMVLETDSPFLTPAPYRREINCPQHVATIAEFLAKLRGESVEELAAATTRNAEALFGGLE